MYSFVRGHDLSKFVRTKFSFVYPVRKSYHQMKMKKNVTSAHH